MLKFVGRCLEGLEETMRVAGFDKGRRGGDEAVDWVEFAEHFLCVYQISRVTMGKARGARELMRQGKVDERMDFETTVPV